MTAVKLATYADILALPEGVVGQLIAGELTVSPRPNMAHARVSSLLGGELHGPFYKGRGGPGGWWIIFEPELHLGSDILVPDLAGWRQERVPTLSAAPFMTMAPNWVCEVLSPSTARVDRVAKLPIYAREKVDHVWLIDPAARTLEVYARADNHWLLLHTFGGSDSVRAAPFEAIAIELADFWVGDEHAHVTST